jgi:hypothetical protein
MNSRCHEGNGRRWIRQTKPRPAPQRPAVFRTMGGTLILVAALTITGCTNGAESAAQKATASKSAPAAAAAQARAQGRPTQRTRRLAQVKARETAVYMRCRRDLLPLINKLSVIRAKVSLRPMDVRGPTFDQYANQLDAATRLYDHSPHRPGHSEPCVDHVAIPLQSALNAYITAANKWLHCVNADSICVYWGTDPKRKYGANWARAAKLLTAAKSALAAMQPSATPGPVAEEPSRPTDSVEVENLREGDCLSGDLPDGDVELVQVGPCSQPHREEVSALFNLGSGPSPSQGELDHRAKEGCQRRFAKYVGLEYENSGLDYDYISPYASDWPVDRLVVCFVVDFAPHTGTMKGSRR